MVAYADTLIFIHDQGLFVIDSLEALPQPDVANILFRDSENIGSSAPLPPVLPHSLIKIRTAMLSELLCQYTQRLQRAGWTQVEQDHRDLLSAYRGEPVFKNALDNRSDANTGFNDGWALYQGRFDYLREILGGLATM
ncbi:hypothetical protein PsorP6_008398 [Peronosclerospora sorghi]|uniref:Uncharacterized protein n=1 Tax=Peronosclerospora sorghi TaxID=230839 RepID=A0ACC0WA08_9STRA|nr:hypothetical protein PsorP6_008398 [Peronosclerospora sorghi]